MVYPSDYNAALRSLGLPELPDCEQCGLQIRRNMESPVNVILGVESHRFCKMECAQAWLNARHASG